MPKYWEKKTVNMHVTDYIYIDILTWFFHIHAWHLTPSISYIVFVSWFTASWLLCLLATTWGACRLEETQRILNTGVGHKMLYSTQYIIEVLFIDLMNKTCPIWGKIAEELHKWKYHTRSNFYYVLTQHADISFLFIHAPSITECKFTL